MIASAFNVARRGVLWADAMLWRARWEIRQAQQRAARRARPWPMFVAIAVLALTACGGVERHARTALDVSAHALVTTDAIVADVYERRAAEALEAATSLDDYRDRMQALDRTEAALRVARSSLLAAQSGLDAHGAGNVLGSIGCVADAFDTLLDALAEIGVDPPPKLRRAIDAIRAVAGDRCEVPS